jgi:hypothetical protein
MGDDNLLDWTISNAPSSSDAPPAPLPPGQPSSRPSGPRRAFSRWTWVILAALPVLALLYVTNFPRLENQRIQREVEAVIAQQEQARLAGDWPRLRGTFADDNMGWPNDQITRMRNGGFASPIQLPGLGSAHQAGRVSQFQVLGPQLVRADVVRAFELVDGTQVNLALPQFYQFAAGAWQQIAPPETPTDQALQLHGARVDVTYFPADTELAHRLLNDLDALLARACADWDCPADVRVPVRFDGTSSSLVANSSGFSLLLMDSWTFQLIYARQAATIWREVSLPTSLQGGYAADGPAAQAVLRAASIEALLIVAQRLAPETIRHGENTYLDALVTREAARLGLEQPQLAEMQMANPLYDPDGLWSLPRVYYFSDGAWPEALAILNQLLAQRAVGDERQLLHAFDSATEPRAWLAAGLGLSLEQASTQLATAAAFSAPMPPAPAPGFMPDLVLNCPTGPVLATLAGQMAPLFPQATPGSRVVAWSPDGQRLAVLVSGRLGIVDLVTGAGSWAPLPLFPYGVSPSWASAAALVYPASTLNQNNGPFQGNDLAVFDTRSGQYLSPTEDTYSNTYSYQVSPNGVWAVMIGSLTGTDSTLAVIPALGGSTVLTVTNGFNASWAPDSQRLAYAIRDGDSFSLSVFNLSSGMTSTLLATGQPNVPAVPHGDSFSLNTAWSPAGDQLAVTGIAFGNQDTSGWAGLMAPDGNGFHILPLASAIATPYSASFSADGQFLAVGVASFPQIGTAIYSVSDERLLRLIPDMQSMGWSPVGHTLALSGYDGFSLLPEPGDASAKPQPFGPAGCRAIGQGLLWRPR